MSSFLPAGVTVLALVLPTVFSYNGTAFYMNFRAGWTCSSDHVCQTHEILSDPWRNIGFNASSFSGGPRNDSNLQEGWYEFRGIGGDRLDAYCLSLLLKDNILLLNYGSENPDGVNALDLNTCDITHPSHVDCGGGLVLYYLIPINGFYAIFHSFCDPWSCGEYAVCGPNGSCQCEPGVFIQQDFLPTGDFYGCSELVLQLKDSCQVNFTAECAEELLSVIQNISVKSLPRESVIKYLNKVLDCMKLLNTSTDTNLLISYGNDILNAVEKLVYTLVKTTNTSYGESISLPGLDVHVFVIGPNASLKETPQLNTSSAYMDIDLIGISKNNNGSAAVAFVSYKYLSSFLKPTFFNTNDKTIKTMMSTVVSATLPTTNNTQLTTPVNFTLKHVTSLVPGGNLSCVYWNKSVWDVDGCEVSYTNCSYTTCSCVHLSTFALIMQTGQVPAQDESPAHKLLNMVAVSIGLVFLSLALLTFAFAQRDSRVTNVTLINLCLSLLLAHLLFLLTQEHLKYIKINKLCAAMAGVLHFLFLSAFVWMFIEAVLLFIYVRNLTKIRINKGEILSWKYLIVIGYIIPLVVVGVTVGLFPDAYGSEECWIKKDKGFTWSFLGPVCTILTSNLVLFGVMTILLRCTLRNLNKDVAKFRETKILIFKTFLQLIILGCSWILGFFIQRNEVLEIIFLCLNSQQGTFIFLVHCVLNQEVRMWYRKCYKKCVSVCCSCCIFITTTRGKIQ
ncbi:adhesion G protein-coupled receptor E3-like [Hoplias malabaricus]|uniref:adhesion G protein-coupled receptor E3-like n=1 Tax=Hoplias malabaricus TaxID=27720 RepID=UPI0034617E51